MLVPVVEEYELGNVPASLALRADSAYLVDMQPVVDANWKSAKPGGHFFGTHIM